MSGVNGRGAASSSSPLVDSIVAGDRQGVGGILCNDSRGLCVATQGAPTLASPQDSGIYTSLVRLTSKLQQPTGEDPSEAPLITLETSDKAILVKDYAGYAVAVQIPKKSLSLTDAADGGDV